MLEARSQTWNVPVPCEPHLTSPTLVLKPLPFEPHLPTLIWSPGTYTFSHLFLPKTLKAGHFQSLFNILLNRDSFNWTYLYSHYLYVVPLWEDITWSPVSSPYPFRPHGNSLTHGNSLNKEMSLKTNKMTHPEGHCPLREAQALLLLLGLKEIQRDSEY